MPSGWDHYTNFLSEVFEMQRYLVFRIAQSIVALIGVTMIVFALTRISGNVLEVMLPEDATAVDYARISEAWGLDKPMIVQYGIYVRNVLQGDWGESWKWGTSALEIVLNKFPATLQLASFTLAVSTALGIALGMLVATKKDTVFDYGGKVLGLLGQSLPSF
jgi:peptide/nickel transport system permease protein